MDYSSVSSLSAREFVPAAVPAKGPAAPTAPVSANDAPFSFWDLLDVVNPLQHIPVVNSIYREATGDSIKTPMKIIGSTIIGGPIGFASAVVDGLVEETTGKDSGAHAIALLKPATPAETQVADAREFVPAAVNFAVADAREFVPEAVNVAVADAREFVPMPLAGEVSETAVADAREFIPAAIATPTRLAAAASEDEALAAGNELLRLAALREARNTRLAAAPAPRPTQVAAAAPPSETEAMIAAAQIAAKAHVRVPAVASSQSKTPQQVAAAGDRFMPIRATAQARELTAPRVSTASGSTAELQSLMARTRYSPGVRGNRDISPAILAQANKPRATAAPAAAASQYELARQIASGGAPQEVPAWFDDAMLSAIDKYNASKTTTPGL